MRMATNMTPDPSRQSDLLTLTQWLSPAFPLGSYAYSHGLEQAISEGTVHDLGSLARWLDALLCHGSLRNEALLLSLTHRRVMTDDALASVAVALCAGTERYSETRDQGRAFVETLNAMRKEAELAMPLPIAIGIRSRELDVELVTVLALFLQCLVANLVLVATRSIPLGQSVAQICLSKRAEVIKRTADACGEAGIEDLGTASLSADLASLWHETLAVRHFRS